MPGAMAGRCAPIPGNPAPSEGCKGELEHPISWVIPMDNSDAASPSGHHHPLHKEASGGPTGLRNSLLTSGWMCAVCAGTARECEGEGILWRSSSWSIVPQHRDMARGWLTPQPWNSPCQLPGKVRTSAGRLGAPEIPGTCQEGFSQQRTHPALLIPVP